MFANKIVELDDDRSYVILDKTVLDSKTYYYALRLDDKDEPTNHYLFFEELIDDGEYYLDPIDSEDLKKLLVIAFTVSFADKTYDL